MKTVKLILGIALFLLLYSCVKPVLHQKEYKVIDTLELNYSNFGSLEGAKVIVKYDSYYHYGVLDKWGNLMHMNPRNLNVDRIK